MDDLARLCALEDIRMLKAQFFRAVDEQDWPAYAALFTPDACFRLADPFDGRAGEGLRDTAGLRGGAAMAAQLAAALAGTCTVHVGGLPVIEFETDDVARARWPVEDWLWFAPGDPRPPLHGFGRYDEAYRRTPDGWRIAVLGYTRIRYATGERAAA